MTKQALAILLIACTFAGAQTDQENDRRIQQTQSRGYWIDPSTGLMWAAKDNGQNINWGHAMKYCQKLYLAGYSDWRLASMVELQGIYQENPYASRPAPKGTEYVFMGAPRGGLQLTGNHYWSSTIRLDDRGKRSGYAYFFMFDLPNSSYNSDPTGYFGSKRALCVRTPSK